MGDWSATEISKRYAISSIPAYMLISSDGDILAQETSLEKIAVALEASNGKPSHADDK